jgi:hypothetical protein
MQRTSLRTLSATVALWCAGLLISTASINAQAGGYRISGKVVSSVSNAPLSQARVTIQSTSGGGAEKQSMITGESGSFAFPNLPAGKYSLSAARRGFVEAMFDEHERYSTAIVTGGEADSQHLVFRLTPQAILSGRVVDENGDPVRKANVTLYRQTQRTGMSRIGRAALARTDDRGTYEFAALPAGV